MCAQHPQLCVYLSVKSTDLIRVSKSRLFCCRAAWLLFYQWNLVIMPYEKNINKLFSLLAFVFVSMMLINAAMRCRLLNIEEFGHKTDT